MKSLPPIPRPASIAIDDMLDTCAQVRSGQQVLILAYSDGLRGGDNLVDRQAIEWLEAGVRQRGATPVVLRLDERSAVHQWRFPPVVRAAWLTCDLMINNTLDLSFEELVEFKKFTWDEKKLFVRNFATTSSLLGTEWARTPHELVSEIRHQAALQIEVGARWELSDPNGTHLEGEVLPAFHANHPWFANYALRREEMGYYRPWPEWVVPPIRIAKTSGEFVFDRMLSWWARYIGISPYFGQPIRLEIQDNHIKRITGGSEAEALRSFLADLEVRTGARANQFDALHFGVHPRASVSAEECPSILYRRTIEHAHSSNIHVHIGGLEPTKEYPYWAHITGDVRMATFKVGDTLVHDAGRLTALDHPAVRAVALKFPERPGL